MELKGERFQLDSDRPKEVEGTIKAEEERLTKMHEADEVMFKKGKRKLEERSVTKFDTITPKTRLVNPLEVEHNVRDLSKEEIRHLLEKYEEVLRIKQEDFKRFIEEGKNEFGWSTKLQLFLETLPGGGIFGRPVLKRLNQLNIEKQKRIGELNRLSNFIEILKRKYKAIF